MKIIVGCSGANEIAKKVAARLKLIYTPLLVKYFPDGEMKIRFAKQIKGKEIFLVQSFYGNVNEKILETLFTIYTAKDLGAKKIILLATYFPYFRQDKRFKPGESISLNIIGTLFNQAPVDKILIIEPHLHRRKKIKEIFQKGEKISLTFSIAEFIRKRFKDYVLVGPDKESEQWVFPIAKLLNKNYFFLRKKRFSAKKVKILSRIKSYPVSRVILIDDICSTGGTLLESIKKLKSSYKKISCIIIHGLFVESALKKIRKVAELYSTNTISLIPPTVAKIDITKLVSDVIKNA